MVVTKLTKQPLSLWLQTGGGVGCGVRLVVGGGWGGVGSVLCTRILYYRCPFCVLGFFTTGLQSVY